ncbi:conserved protein of unknown function [Rhodovastum atsumiense]|uniref:Uncharacterized protein n=1 Tax=Rhodovastum atsumiense TaxID=504468 RepID=A0A5M6J350_9PROT|nr:hypothetical protein [Rhodovastum atsumiense]KAA5614075.1 hypothetical protein F1189_02400 [Rhodovastum atsumiense]CAH2598894.1 conserved protein of unknown function [Rhodovastum atsumiense]
MTPESDTDLIRQSEKLRARALATELLVKDGTLTPQEGLGRLAAILAEAARVMEVAVQQQLMEIKGLAERDARRE